MKNLYLLTGLLMMFCSITFAQTPEKLSYQAIIRNSSDQILVSQPVGIQISILQTSATGTAIYVETQTPSTNENGLISIEIGNGNIVSGTFNTIDWSNDTYFVKTEIDPEGGSSYTITGTSQLLSVPYALHAKTAESIKGGITETDPTFASSPANSIANTDITNWNNKLSAEVDGSVTNEIELPTGGNDGQVLKTDGSGNYAWVDQITNTDTQLTETQVDTYVANNGYLSAEVDGSVTNEIELPTGGNDGQVLKTDGSGNYAWVDQTTDTDTNTQLTETQVDAFVANNGYLTAEVDGSVTNEIELPTGGYDGQVLKTDGSGNYAWVDQTTDNDTNTQLSETQVDAFVANNGYLTAEVDGSVTNEIELPTGGNDGQVLKTDGSGNYAWVDQTEGTSYTAGNGIEISNNEISSTMPEFAYINVGNNSTNGNQSLSAQYPSSTYVNGITVNASSITLNANKLYEITLMIHAYNSSGNHTYIFKNATDDQYIYPYLMAANDASTGSVTILLKPSANVNLELIKLTGADANVIGSIFIKEIK